MIAFEVLLFLLVVPALLRPVLPVARLPRWLDYLPSAALALAVLHYFIQPAWFRLVPAYLLILIAFLLSVPRLVRPASPRPGSLFRRVLGVVGMLVGLLWFAVALALPILLPMRSVQATGPYAIGTATYEWADTARQEIYTDDPADVRELAVQFWYPTDQAAGGRGTSSIQGALLSSKEAVFPVLIFSHGGFGVRSSNTSTYQELASHGYVVASIDHTYLNLFTRFSDGRMLMTSPRYQAALNQSLAGEIEGEAGMQEMYQVRAEDMRFVMDQIAQLNVQGTAELPAGRLDVEHLGLFGHSAGGSTAGAVCREDPRCKAALIVDGTLYGDILGLTEDLKPIVTEELFPQPIMFMYSGDLFYTEKYKDGYSPNVSAYQKTAQPAYQLIFEDTNHLNLTDLGMMVARPVFSLFGVDQALVGAIDPVLCTKAFNAYTLAFFDRHMKGLPAPLLDGSAQSYPFIEYESRN